LVDGLSITHSTLSLIPYHLAVEYFALPIGLDSHGRIETLMAYPHDAETIQAIQLHTGVPVKPVPADKDMVMGLIARHYAVGGTKKDASAEGRDTPKRRVSLNVAGSTTAMVDDIVQEALKLRASDIHFEPFEREMCCPRVCICRAVRRTCASR
jgi:type IV pilus assembly protein PilB